MHIHVATQLSIPAADRCLPDWREVHRKRMPHQVTLSYKGFPLARPDAIVMMGIGSMKETKRLLESFPGVPLFSYHWDCYSWVWSNPRPGEYDYNEYSELLLQSLEIWTPSMCTSRQAQKDWKIDPGRLRVILSCAPTWEPKNGIRDGGYLLCTLREIPDPMWGVLEEICDEQEIPLHMTRHEKGYEAYKEEVANCRAMVSPLQELSTGGLSLLEGYALGKPVMLNGALTHGGRDYFGSRADYFYGREDLRRKIRRFYEEPPTVKTNSKDWVEEKFSDERMVRDILRRIEARFGLVT